MGNKQKHSSDTKQYKIKRSRRENKADTIKERKHPKLRKLILIFIILVLLLNLPCKLPLLNALYQPKNNHFDPDIFYLLI